MSKVIFVDIDGVLNCRQTPNSRRFPYIVDAALLSRFKALVANTKAQVVLSSTWRYDPIGLFAARHHGIPFDDVTPDLPERPRSDEILSWLQAHRDVDRYTVIDDEDDELDELPLFQPSPTTGLTNDIAAGVQRYLNGETNKVMRPAVWPGSGKTWRPSFAAILDENEESMDNFSEWIDAAMGLSLRSEQLGIGHMTVRAAVMYLALIVLVRLGKKRFLGGATAFDYILVVMIGAVAGRAMTGGSPYFASLLGVLVLILMHWVFSAVAQRSCWFSHFIKGNATRLIKDGQIDFRALARSHMSMDDLSEDLRSQGERDTRGIAEAYLERSGKLSVLK